MYKFTAQPVSERMHGDIDVHVIVAPVVGVRDADRVADATVDGSQSSQTCQLRSV